jgi:hypothetical protein
MTKMGVILARAVALDMATGVSLRTEVTSRHYTQYIPSTLLMLIAQSYFWTPVMRGEGRSQHEVTTAPRTS